MNQSPRLTDHTVEQLLGNLLRWGVTVAAAVAAVGGVILLAKFGAHPANYRVFTGEPADLRSVSSIVSLALAFDARGIIQLGILCLIATPVARVAMSLVAFAFQRDFLYVMITALVLALLCYSLFAGHQ